jgi:hypothetical protein
VSAPSDPINSKADICAELSISLGAVLIEDVEGALVNLAEVFDVALTPAVTVI